jgi:hypothetical protein
MDDSERHELQAIREDVMEIKGTCAEVRESLKRSQKASGRQTLYMLGLPTMVVGITLTRVESIVLGLVIFGIGVALCLSLFSAVYRFYRAVGLKIKLKKLTRHLFGDWVEW